jgi:2-hydroxychromene-2-carboxylate isomerase
MPGRIDFWFDLGSTYSYPAAMRIEALAAAAAIDVSWRPFALGAVFKAQGWPADSPFNWQDAKGRYMWRDLERICAAQRLPFRRPQPFPQPSLLAMRVALAGEDASFCAAFALATFRAEFANGRAIGDRSVLADLLRGLGKEPADMLARAESEDNKARLRAQTAEAQRLGIFGAPSFVCSDGELFWGNDRLERALAWEGGERMPADSRR